MGLSNLNGRVLEYILVLEMKNTFNNDVVYTNATIKSNTRDKSKIVEIDNSLLDHFKSSSLLICEKLISYFNDDKTVYIDRLDDDLGTRGDVTDIRIFNDKKNLNLSIKNNNLAVKHQRPGPTPKHLNLESSHEDFLSFKKKYSIINTKFFEKSNDLVKNVKLYDEVELIKFDDLYYPTCCLVSDLINKHTDKGGVYQDFLIGTVNFKKIILFKNRIEIHSYDNLPKSKKMSSWVKNKNYVVVNFHNNIILKMRLHTASSKIKKLGNLKFDTKVEKIDVPKEIIKL